MPTMADVAALTRDSDYAPFVRPGVDASVKNAALKRLFTDPHFNVMDGLDTYIDDYGKPDPIPPGMLRQLRQARSLGLFEAAPEPLDAHNAAPAGGSPGAEAPVVAQSAAVPSAEAQADAAPTLSHDDPDLRLQQDDGAGPAGAAPGPRA
jgi:hypothetical protein